ncbi:MAG TPA: hypothetical protein VMJ12_02305 [Candidatus Acidoferrales bacterium]|nr:hypothetical protein [Candidatus Acidoferrales bacterium]
MKTRIMTRPSGRITTTVTMLSAVMLFLAGCVVTSIYPYYTDKDLVSDPALVGEWVDASKTNETSEYLRFEPVGEKGYRATFFGTDETNSIDVFLFRLKEQLFVDSFPTNRSLDFVPVHQVSKVTQIGSALETANLNYDWLAKLVENHPNAIRHMVLREKPGDDQGGRIILTADTKELQRFILKYVSNTNAWKEPTRWKHRS